MVTSPSSPRNKSNSRSLNTCKLNDVAGIRISDAAARSGVSTRTLRYYEELGLLCPSGYTQGGERRYLESDLFQLDRILELKELLGLNLEEIKNVLDLENRLNELRSAYRANEKTPTDSAHEDQRIILEEAIELRTFLANQIDLKLDRMKAFRDSLASDIERCRHLLSEL